MKPKGKASKANKETDKDKKKRNKEPEKVKDDEGKQKEKQATPQRADTKDTKEPKASKADKGKARSSLQGQDKDDTNARDAALLDRFKAKNRECEVFADEEWWNAKVVKWRFNEEEARDEVYIHFQGTGKEEDVWMPLSGLPPSLPPFPPSLLSSCPLSSCPAAKEDDWGFLWSGAVWRL